VTLQGGFWGLHTQTPLNLCNNIHAVPPCMSDLESLVPASGQCAIFNYWHCTTVHIIGTPNVSIIDTCTINCLFTRFVSLTKFPNFLPTTLVNHWKNCSKKFHIGDPMFQKQDLHASLKCIVAWCFPYRNLSSNMKLESKDKSHTPGHKYHCRVSIFTNTSRPTKYSIL